MAIGPLVLLLKMAVAQRLNCILYEEASVTFQVVTEMKV